MLVRTSLFTLLVVSATLASPIDKDGLARRALEQRAAAVAGVKRDPHATAAPAPWYDRSLFEVLPLDMYPLPTPRKRAIEERAVVPTAAAVAKRDVKGGEAGEFLRPRGTAAPSPWFNRGLMDFAALDMALPLPTPRKRENAAREVVPTQAAALVKRTVEQPAKKRFEPVVFGLDNEGKEESYRLAVGQVCSANSQCTSDVCHESMCVPQDFSGVLDSQCNLSTQCMDDLFCNRGICEAKVVSGAACYLDAGCYSGHCVSGSCVEPRSLTLGLTCTKTQQCVANAFCDQSSCVKTKSHGQTCYKHEACKSGFCGANRKCA